MEESPRRSALRGARRPAEISRLTRPEFDVRIRREIPRLRRDHGEHHRRRFAMHFRIQGLDPQPFAPLFALSDKELAGRRALRKTSDQAPGFPCRITLRDADPGTTVLLLTSENLPVDSPYRASHAIYVTEATGAFDEVDTIPPAFRE